MIQFDRQSCVSCGACVDDCFARAIEMKDGFPMVAARERCILCGHCFAICPTRSVTVTDCPNDDVFEYNQDLCALDPDNLLHFIGFRRSVRHYKDKPAEREKLLKVIEAGRHTPTARNLQGTSFAVIQEGIGRLRELIIDKLGDIGKAMIEADRGEKLSGEKLLYIHDTFYGTGEDRLFFNAPAVILVLSDRHGARDACGAAANMELMANALGLGVLISGYTAMAASDPAVREFLRLKDGVEVARCMVIGYPDIQFLRSAPRKAPDITWL